ncbi:MAG: hypothetical protein J0I12_01775 [Candidatus Eremiobacteraeota bacterium]|nr:hypothetical protein [Candidatus Eremiobacteraeota bacterium]
MNELIDIKVCRCREDVAVEVSLAPGDSQFLETVQVTLNGILLNPEREGRRHHRATRYVRNFQRVTQWFPGLDHELVVTAQRQDGAVSSSTLRWNSQDDCGVCRCR